MKKIVMTGGSGFIGTRFYQMFHHQFDIKALSSKDLDMTDQAAIDAYIDAQKPDYVFHFAGLANQQYCIDHPQKAYAVNVLGSECIAKACKRVGAKLVFASTEQIFNGSSEAGPYTEDSTPVPNTVYGENKWEVEQKLPSLLDEYWIVRFTWIFGLPEKNCASGSNILMDTLKSVFYDQPIQASEYEFRGMTDVDELCVNLVKLLDLPYGTYHMGSTNNNGRYEIVRFIMEEMGLPEERISKLLIKDNSKYDENHPRELRLDNTKAKNAGMVYSDTKEAIHNCLKKFSLIK